MGTCGMASDGSPCGQLPHDLDAVVAAQVHRRAERDRAKEHHQASRNLLAQSRKSEEQEQGGCTHTNRDPISLWEFLEHTDELLGRVSRCLGHAEQLVELPDGDKDREADDETVHHGLGQELLDEAKSRQPCREIDETYH
jgi:hypothetical protein